jgi:hypothetical protein
MAGDVTKVSKAEASYREGSPRRHCGICTMFISPDGCTKVRGEIEADDVCDYFEKKPSVTASIKSMMWKRK